MRSLSSDPENQGTLSLIADLIITHPDAGQEATGAAVCALVKAAEVMFAGFYNDKADHHEQYLRKLSLVEVVRLRAAFQVVLDAIENIPPHAFMGAPSAPTLTLIHGGGS